MEFKIHHLRYNSDDIRSTSVEFVNKSENDNLRAVFCIIISSEKVSSQNSSYLMGLNVCLTNRKHVAS